MVFADNVDPSHTALSALALADPGAPAELGAPFDVDAARTHGVIVCAGSGVTRTMVRLVEKPDRLTAARLVGEYGAGALRLLLGRMRLTPHLVVHIAAQAEGASGEPKLSLAVASYAATWPVQVITASQPMVDLGARTSGGQPVRM